jgi:hypothetical protein
MIRSSLKRSPFTSRGGKLRPRRKCLPGSEADIKQRLTILFSLYIRQRDPFCIICGRPSTDASHLWHRDMPPTEFDVENVWGCCHNCNMAHETKPQPMHDAVFKRLGERRYADLADRSHSQTKLTYIELTILYEEIERKVAA